MSNCVIRPLKNEDFRVTATCDGKCVFSMPAHVPAKASDVNQGFADIRKQLKDLSRHRLLADGRHRVQKMKIEAQAKRITQLQDDLAAHNTSINTIRDQIDDLQTTLWSKVSSISSTAVSCLVRVIPRSLMSSSTPGC